MEEIAIKKPKIVVDLFAVADVCIEAFKARAWLFESRGKGPSKKKQDDQEVNTTDRGDRGIVETTGITAIASSSLRIKRRWSLSSVLPMQRSGAISIAL
jgi:hypothetical protein